MVYIDELNAADFGDYPESIPRFRLTSLWERYVALSHTSPHKPVVTSNMESISDSKLSLNPSRWGTLVGWVVVLSDVGEPDYRVRYLTVTQ